ncbi:MAG: class I SAM-dependent methyltransferase [Nitrososphaerota archaeon]
MKIVLQTLNFLLRFLNRGPPKPMTFENIISHFISLIRNPDYFTRIHKLLTYRIYFYFHPNYPWLTPQANSIIMGTLKGNELGIEFGAGISTLFLAERCKRLISIEDDPVWYYRVSSWLKKRVINNVSLKLIRDKEAYINEIKKVSDEYFDFILIDGSHRLEIFINALSKVKLGGFIIFDNSDSHPYKEFLDKYYTKIKEQYIRIRTIGPLQETTFLVRKK